MAKSAAELKAQARQQLNGRWAGPVIVTLVVIIITFSISLVAIFINPFLNLISIVLTAPLNLGIIMYMLKFANYENVDVPEVFNGFNRWIDSIILNFLVGIYVFLWILPFFILYVTFLVLFIVSTNWLYFWIVIASAIAIVVWATIKGLAYYISYYIMAENPKIKPTEAIKWSKKITKGHIGRIFYIQLSFIGWSILATFTLGIGFLWLSPYMGVTMANLYFDLKDLNPEYYDFISSENPNDYYNKDHYNPEDNSNRN